jgi:hypothetical protein
VTGNPTTRDQVMTKQNKLIDHFTKVNDNYSITNCQNGYVVDVSGQDSSEEWISAKFVFKTIDELKDVVQDLAWMPRT